MGGLCPCPKRKEKPMPYDVNEETFEIEENIPSPAVKQQSNPFQTLNEEGPPSHEVDKEQDHPEPQKQQIRTSQVIKESEVQMATHQSLIQPPKEQKKKPTTTSAIAAPPARKKPNLDDYRFVQQEGTFRVKKLDSLNQQQFNIDGCRNCTFFIFDITANVYVDECDSCTIFIAPCESTVFLRDCKNLRVVAATKQFRVRDCFDCQVGLYCPSQPVIESSKGMLIAPFPQLGYPQLLEQFKKSKMEVWNNHWSEIHDFTKKAGEQHFELKASIPFELQWQKGLEEAELAPSSAVVPTTLGEIPSEQETKPIICVVSNQYLQAHQSDLLGKIIEQNITVRKTFKGKLPAEVYSLVQDSFPSQKAAEHSLCLLFDEPESHPNLTKFEEIGLEEFEHYMKFQEQEEVKRLLPLLFVSFRDEH